MTGLFLRRRGLSAAFALQGTARSFISIHRRGADPDNRCWTRDGLTLSQGDFTVPREADDLPAYQSTAYEDRGGCLDDRSSPSSADPIPRVL
jgi:hypothetical protein